jgi:hypothetical protein
MREEGRRPPWLYGSIAYLFISMKIWSFASCLFLPIFLLWCYLGDGFCFVLLCQSSVPHWFSLLARLVPPPVGFGSWFCSYCPDLEFPVGCFSFALLRFSFGVAPIHQCLRYFLHWFFQPVFSSFTANRPGLSLWDPSDISPFVIFSRGRILCLHSGPIGFCQVRPDPFSFLLLPFAWLDLRSWHSWNRHHRSQYSVSLSALHRVKVPVRGYHHRSFSFSGFHSYVNWAPVGLCSLPWVATIDRCNTPCYENPNESH